MIDAERFCSFTNTQFHVNNHDSGWENPTYALAKC